jgi:hypothetical protein
MPVRSSSRAETVSTEDTLPEVGNATATATPQNLTLASPTLGANNGLDIVGAGVKVLLHEIKRLERDGIETDVSLPKIVVAGDQSSGKSSLIEAIS